MIKQYLIIVNNDPVSSKGSFVFDRDEAVVEFKEWKKRGNKVKLKYQKTLF